MKRILFVLLLFSSFVVPSFSYKLLYAEEYYKLYHQNLYQYPEDYTGNIWFLEQALGRPFVNPLNALTKIDTKDQWKRYRYLFYMHVNLKLVEQYRYLARSYDKQRAYFYNAPWKEDTLKSLNIAESYYKAAEYYWKEALVWVKKLKKVHYYFLENIQFWEDERIRITTGELDYKDSIQTDLSRLATVRKEFEAMNASTY